MSDSVIEIRTAKVWSGRDGILRVVSQKVEHGTIQDSRELWEAVKSASAGRICPLLADIRNTSPIEAESRRYFSRPETKGLVSAVALLVESPFSRVVGSIFLGMNRLPVPVRLFTSEEQALEWLREFRDNSDWKGENRE